MKKRKQRRPDGDPAATLSENATPKDVPAVEASPGAAERTEPVDAPETTTQDPVELADASLFAAAPENAGDADDDLGEHDSDARTDADIAAAGGGLDPGANAAATAELDEERAAAPPGEEVADAEPLPQVEEVSRLESIIESLLFAADRPLLVNELKRLLGERDGKRLTEALDNLRVRHADSGIQLVSVAGGWQLRTHPGNGAWVAKLVAGRPTRLSRAMMETLAIVAYRQPITRPEIDEIRGVDCGPVLRTLLDRALIRVIGKKEEVGRPILYGTTPEFLKIFSLRDLADLPTLREFHELGADDRAKVDATSAAPGAAEGVPGFGLEGAGSGAGLVGLAGAGGRAVEIPRPVGLSDVDPKEEDSLIEALEEATNAAGRATRSLTDPASTEEPAADGATASISSDAEASQSSSGER